MHSIQPFYGSRLARTAALVLCAALALPLLAAADRPAPPLRLAPYHTDGIYQVGEKAGWRVTPAAETPATAKFHYVIKRNNFTAIATGEFDLASGQATIETTLDAPGMVYVEVTPADAPVAKDEAARDQVKALQAGAAFEPWRIRRAAPRPADFDAFWDGKLKAQAALPINARLTPTITATAGVELYTVQLDALGSHVHGYLAKPAREGKFPALMLYQWAGVYALNPDWATKRAEEGWLVFDVGAHDLFPNESHGVPAEYFKIGENDRETSYFLFMYLRDARAIDYLKTRPDWDGRTIVIMGTSMGGHQSLVAAALHPEATAVLVNEPSGANTLGELYGYFTGYPNYSREGERAIAAAPYFDTVNFTSRIQAPVLAAVGFIDTVCPPAGVWMALTQIPGAKEVIGMVESDHNNLTPDKQGAWEARSKEVLDLLLHGGTFVPRERR
jgi:cephalosporin-C deacetylase-like acetyl esterase